jgi:REP-associated tyrosine transposase
MPRKARVILPNTPHHIVQRGHNRKAVFVEGEDYQYYLENLKYWKSELDIKVYSYCLMTNHIHLVVEPGEFPTDVGELMKQLAARQTRYVNKLERRTGLWESRYKISPIETDAYLLQCCRYVELNPVKASMVVLAEDYPWSSYRAKLVLQEESWLDRDACYLGLGADKQEREAAYRAFVEISVSAEEQRFIQAALERNQLTGGNSFIDEVEQRTGLRIEYRGQGRPVNC